MGDIVASREDVTVESTPNVFKALVSAALAEFGDDARVLTMDERFAELVVPGHPVVACNDAASLVIELQMSDRPCIVLPPWGRRAGDLGSFWRGIKMMGMPFAIIIPASGLVQHGLPRGAEHLGVPHLVVEAPAFEPGMPLGIRLALVEIDPTDTAPTTVTRFFKAPDQNDIVLDEVVSDLKQLLRKQGGITEHGFVYRGASLAGQSLRPEDHNPKVAANVADLAEFGQSAVVGDVFEVRRARPMPPEAADALERSAGVRVLRPHEVTLSGEFLPEDVDADEPHPRRFSPVPLQTGDLVLRDIERPGYVGSPVEVQASDLPLAAGSGLLVLRSKVQLDPEEFEFYKLFLGSQRSREVMRASTLGFAIRLSNIRQAPLPRPDADLLSALSDIRRAQEMLLAWASEGARLTSAAFSGPASQARLALIETGRRLRQRVEAANQVGSLDHRIANFYPYPIAHKWRVARMAEGVGDDAKTYTAILDCFQTTMAFGAAIALAFAHANAVEVKAMIEVRRKLSNSSSGTSLGDWVNILKEVSSGRTFKKLDPDAPLSSIRQLLPLDTEVAKAQERLSERRNDESHQRRVDPIDLPSAIDDARKDLELILDHADFFADMPIYQIKSWRWDSIEKSGEAVAQMLRGDHPVNPSVLLKVEEPNIELESLYVKDITGSLVLLRPFLVRHECPLCRTWSTFHPDRRADGTLLLKSVDHSHTISGTSHEPALRAVGYID